jgi:hypothetical protein
MNRLLNSFLLIIVFYQTDHVFSAEDDKYQIGVGIADITGPSAEINMVSFVLYS